MIMIINIAEKAMKENINIKLKEKKYRMTAQRESILEVMLNNQGRHLNAEEVLEEARKIAPAIGIATVYRTLDKLTEKIGRASCRERV